MNDQWTGVSGHAAQRAEQYLGRPIPRELWRAALINIFERRALLLTQQPDGRQRWRVELGPIAVTVVWCPCTATIVTVLPLDGPATRAVAAARAAPIRASVSLPAAHIGGKRRRQRTIWRGETRAG